LDKTQGQEPTKIKEKIRCNDEYDNND